MLIFAPLQAASGVGCDFLLDFVVNTQNVVMIKTSIS